MYEGEVNVSDTRSFTNTLYWLWQILHINIKKLNKQQNLPTVTVEF